MIRVAISTYLMLAAVAGPAQCCCFSARLADSVPAGAQATDGTSSGGTPSCCHARHKKTATNEAQPVKHEHKGGPQDRPGCPCQDHTALLVSALPQTGLTADEFQRIVAGEPVAFFAVPMYASLLPGASHQEAAGDGSLLFFDASDLLHLHHLLRC